MERTILVNIEAVDVSVCQLNVAVDRLTRCFGPLSGICPGSSRRDLDTQIATHLLVPISRYAGPKAELLLDFQA